MTECTCNSQEGPATCPFHGEPLYRKRAMTNSGDKASALRELVAKWRKGPWPTIEENPRLAYKEGVLDCADELDAALARLKGEIEG